LHIDHVLNIPAILAQDASLFASLQG
jgi:hypothetical protein